MARSPKRRLTGGRTRRVATKAIVQAKTQQSAAPERPATPASPHRRSLRRGGVANLVVMTLSVGIVGTLAIPAYAFAPGSEGPQFGTSAEAALMKADPQSVDVAADASAAPVSQDSLAVTTGDSIRAAAAAEEARQAAETQMASYAASYSGPSVGDLLANPPYPNFDLASVYNVATQYIGVPYVYGGATPAGFDCSGFVMYVYAQFGIGMPHSSAGQGAMGTPIAESAAVPGDLVIMSGHDGFYAGGGMILHAPYEGASVRVQPIWTSDYSIVRIGI
ncbi:C40 family peptidase [Agromyces soli]